MNQSITVIFIILVGFYSQLTFAAEQTADLLGNLVQKEEMVERDRAVFLIVNTRIGITDGFTLVKNQSVRTKGALITLHRCILDTSKAYRPESRALIEIMDDSSKEKVFLGWISAKHRSISQAIYKEYFFYLEHC